MRGRPGVVLLAALAVALVAVVGGRRPELAGAADSAPPDMSLSVQGPSIARVGETITISFTVANLGTTDWTQNIGISATFSSLDLEFLGNTDPGSVGCVYGAAGAPSTQAGLGCNQPGLVAGQSRLVVVSFRVVGTEPDVISGGLYLPQGVQDPNPANDTFSFTLDQYAPDPPTSITSIRDPDVTGSTSIGGVLSTTTGTFSPSWPYTYQYRWYRCSSAGCSAVPVQPGGSTYTVTAHDSGCSIAAQVTAATGNISAPSRVVPADASSVPGGPCDFLAGAPSPPTGGGGGQGGGSPAPAAPGRLTFATATLPAGREGQAVDLALVASGVGPFRLGIEVGRLPDGVRFRTADAHLIGEPAEHGFFAILVNLTDATGASAHGTLRWTIVAPPTPPLFKSCVRLDAKYPHGVGRPGARDRTTGRRVTNFRRDGKVYALAVKWNKGLDRDRDGIACEAH
jgi:hypothetical protein